MLFNSLHFFFFFIILFFLYYCFVSARYRWALLLIASCYFYSVYIPKFLLVLLSLITIDYFLALHIHTSNGVKKKFLLIVSFFANIGALFFFKYFNFFNESVATVAHALHLEYSPFILQIALPLGLSFHVFQSLSYVIEVYKGKQMPEKHYGIYALYVMFFPQLVAGPIERPQHLLHQFHEAHPFSSYKVRSGLELMLWGFFKKLVIADWVGEIVNHVYIQSETADGFTLLLAAVLFSYQIYCDFSGYSDIAVGAARVFGYDLTSNFNRPFSAESIPDFWRRWHISLSNWLRDYLYYPLVFSGKKITKTRLTVSLIITFTLIGLWHGANWTYVIFGLLHGLFSAVSLLSDKLNKKIASHFYEGTVSFLWKSWRIITTFILVTISFIFFRSETVGQALDIISTIGSALSNPFEIIKNGMHIFSFESLGVTHARFYMMVLAILFLECVQYLQYRKGTLFIVDSSSKLIRFGWYYLLLMLILFFGHLEARSFIYFQF